MTYRSDQDASIAALIEAALGHSGETCAVTDASPQHSAVGESASNGVAKKAVQKFEDRLKTLKAALEIAPSHVMACSTFCFDLQQTVDQPSLPILELA